MENNLTTSDAPLRDSFIFYASFFSAIKKMPRRTHLTLFLAISNFALYGEEPELTGSCAALWDSIRPQLEANNRRWESGKRGAKYGKQGGRPPKKIQPTEEPSKTPVGLLAQTPNENENVNENKNENENVNVAEVADATHTLSEKFYSFLSENTPSILLFREPFTRAQEETICSKYDTMTEIIPILEQMHNNQAHLTKLSAYATFNTYMDVRKQRLSTSKATSAGRKKRYTYEEMCSIVTPSDPTSNFERLANGLWVRKDKAEKREGLQHSIAP